tara:strand:+ start:215 stop:412 length:198 start_codon:yes stop_codon:yes gene_type:complete
MSGGGQSIAMRMRQNKEALFGTTGSGGGQVNVLHPAPGSGGAAALYGQNPFSGLGQNVNSGAPHD